MLNFINQETSKVFYLWLYFKRCENSSVAVFEKMSIGNCRSKKISLSEIVFFPALQFYAAYYMNNEDCVGLLLS